MLCFVVAIILALFQSARSKSYTFSTLMGTGTPAYSGDNGPATSATLYYPGSIWQNTVYETFIADTNNGCVRKISTSNIASTYAGVCNTVAGGAFNSDNIQATLSNLYYPFTIYIDSNSKLYVADYANGRIRLVATNGIISTVAGGGVSVSDGISALAANIYNPFSVWLNSNGVIYIAEFSSFRVRYVTQGGLIYTVAGK